MKKQLQIAGVLALGLTTLNASAILGAKPVQSSDRQDTTPTVQELSNWRPDDAEGSVFHMSAAYWGGLCGPTDLPIATSGVPNARAASITEGKISTTELDWSNGFSLEGVYSADGFDGTTLITKYRFIRNLSQSSQVSVATAVTASMISSYALVPATGTVDQVSLGKGTYSLKWHQHLSAFMSRAPFKVGSVLLYITPGAMFEAVDHTYTPEYIVSTGSNQTHTLPMHEVKIGGGVKVGFHFVQELSEDIGFSGNVHVNSIASQHKLNGSEKLVTTTATTYGAKATAKKAVFSQGLEANLKAYYNRSTDSDQVWTFFLSGDFNTQPASTFVSTPLFGLGSSRASSMYSVGLEAGVGTAF